MYIASVLATMTSWDQAFSTVKFHDGLFRLREEFYDSGCRANIWLVKGPDKDVIIDTGLGVQSLRHHLEESGLIDSPTRPCIVLCTHIHFDHTGGAREFSDVFIHSSEVSALEHARQTETLNYVKRSHITKPCTQFSQCTYKVNPTPCRALHDGEQIDMGEGHYIEVMHVPGHTKGSVLFFYPQRAELFTGDFVYECGSGANFIDWVPNSCVSEYVDSCARILNWLRDYPELMVLPGHQGTLSVPRVVDLLDGYISSRRNICTRLSSTCMSGILWAFFLLGCFRCCPC